MTINKLLIDTESNQYATADRDSVFVTLNSEWPSHKSLINLSVIHLGPYQAAISYPLT